MSDGTTLETYRQPRNFSEWFSTPRPWQLPGVEAKDVEGELTPEERFADAPAEEWVKRVWPGWTLGGSVVVQRFISAVVYRPLEGDQGA